MTSKYDVFISYSHHDKLFVRKLTDRLSSSGISVFFDEKDIAFGEALAESLDRAVQDARYLIVVMSPDYFESQWGRKELELGLSQEFEGNKTKVLPLLHRDCDIPPLLNTKLYADVRTDEAFELSLPGILAVLLESPNKVLTEPQKEDELTQGLGSINSVTAESSELKIMVKELQAKVDAFIGGSEDRRMLENKSEVEIDPRLCFIVMPFAPEELSDVYEYFVKPSIESNCNLQCERGDDVFGSNVVMDDIRHSINRARIVVADLTGRNANVFYEIGIAHTLNKDVLLLSQSMSDVPFDLRHLRVLVYEYTPKGCKKLEVSIAENVNAMLNNEA